jgi:ribosomal-protein-alanine N-acetyltransferase
MDLISSFLNLPPARPHPPLDSQLIGPRVLLRAADSEDWKAWRTLRDLSRSFLIPWEPTWPPNCLSYRFFCSILRRQWREWRTGKAYSFLIFSYGGVGGPTLVGGITLGDVQHSAAQKGTLGYWMGQPYAGQGYMTEAVGLILDFAFNTLHLQRVEAGCLPRNEPSKAILTRLGFDMEGYAKAYLQINGVREDHLLWGKTNPALQRETADIL